MPFALALGVTWMGCRLASCGGPGTDGPPPQFQRAALPTAGRLTVPTFAGGVIAVRSTPSPVDQFGDAPETPLPDATNTPEVTVEIDADPDLGRAPLTVRFNVVAPDGIEDNACEWTFDDGSPPRHGRTVSHTYTQTGGFTARVTVTLSDGRRTTKEAPIQVDEPEESSDPQ